MSKASEYEGRPTHHRDRTERLGIVLDGVLVSFVYLLLGDDSFDLALSLTQQRSGGKRLAWNRPRWRQEGSWTTYLDIVRVVI
jgi:hypothetical protein